MARSGGKFGLVFDGLVMMLDAALRIERKERMHIDSGSIYVQRARGVQKLRILQPVMGS